jgi:aspartate kinase
MKFGGTSVATLDRIKRAAKRVALEVAKGYDVIVIVSAMSGKTNELVGWVNETSLYLMPANMMLWFPLVKMSLQD